MCDHNKISRARRDLFLFFSSSLLVQADPLACFLTCRVRRGGEKKNPSNRKKKPVRVLLRHVPLLFSGVFFLLSSVSFSRNETTDESLSVVVGVHLPLLPVYLLVLFSCVFPPVAARVCFSCSGSLFMCPVCAPVLCSSSACVLGAVVVCCTARFVLASRVISALRKKAFPCCCASVHTWVYRGGGGGVCVLCSFCRLFSGLCIRCFPVVFSPSLSFYFLLLFFLGSALLCSLYSLFFLSLSLSSWSQHCRPAFFHSRLLLLSAPLFGFFSVFFFAISFSVPSVRLPRTTTVLRAWINTALFCSLSSSSFLLLLLQLVNYSHIKPLYYERHSSRNTTAACGNTRSCFFFHILVFLLLHTNSKR
jgi:hypothetical protein